MSIFVRPLSPPPRQPSPDFVPTPLPSPHIHTRARTSSQQFSGRVSSSNTPSHPPGLDIPPSRRLAIARSCDHLADRARVLRQELHPHHIPRRTRSNLQQLPPHLTNYPVTAPSPSSSASEHRDSQRKTSFSTSSCSHSSNSVFPPPVPRVPTSLLSSKESKTILHPRPVNVSSVRFPELDASSHCSNDVPSLMPRKLCKSPPVPHEKHKILGMTCLRFFSLRGSSHKHTSAATI